MKDQRVVRRGDESASRDGQPIAGGPGRQVSRSISAVFTDD